MIRKSSIFAIALLMATAAAAQMAPTLLTCESVNNIRHTCRGDFGSGVVLNRVLSENACIRGKSWDVRRDGKGIWVDKGCRAEFIVGVPVNIASGTFGQTVVCESTSKRMHRCPANTSFGVILARQISSHSCMVGADWGWDENGIWVKNGCRAEFGLGRTPGAPMVSSSRPVVVCESVNNAINHCKADTTFGVSLARQLSDNACVRGDSWGFDSEGIWVKKGCRAEFVLGTQP